MSSGQWEGGKGSRTRKTDNEKFSSNWDKIFGNKDKKDEPEKQEVKKEITRPNELG